jgi:hypothetical protein
MDERRIQAEQKAAAQSSVLGIQGAGVSLGNAVTTGPWYGHQGQQGQLYPNDVGPIRRGINLSINPVENGFVVTVNNKYYVATDFKAAIEIVTAQTASVLVEST